MTSDELFGIATLPNPNLAGAMVLELLAGFNKALRSHEAVDLFRRGIDLIGAESGVFLSAIKDDATCTSYRSLFACDPLWAIEYARADWHDHDPWLRHARGSEEPVTSEELDVMPSEEEFVRTAARMGFASALVIPAPSSAGSSRLGVLVLGSNSRRFMDGQSYEITRIVARALAMELHGWMLHAVRDDLIARSRITREELELLRHEIAGHSSKAIAQILNMTPKAVDSRFQRANAKLGASDRRSATRIAKLYGLL